MKACEHLDYDGEYVDCKIIELDDFDVPVKYWERGSTWTEGTGNEGNPVRVQFCKKRGRINDIFQCYNPGEMSCYSFPKETKDGEG